MEQAPTREQIEFHYRLERELADRIRRAPRELRPRITLEAYDELFRRVPWHMGLLQSEAAKAEDARSYRAFIRCAGSGHDILEIGCGGGEHLRLLAASNRRCVGIDISAEAIRSVPDLPANVELRVADAVDLSLFPDASFDIAFSKQLIEHIHPDDVLTHLREVCRVLRPGGRYVFETPNRIIGPHDISRYFDKEATAFHLKEYDFRTILPLLRQAGFRAVRTPYFRHRVYKMSPLLGRWTEMPAQWRIPGEFIAVLIPRGRARQLVASACRLNLFILATR